MMKGKGLLASLLGKKAGKGMNDESSVSITIEKEMEDKEDMAGGGSLKMVEKNGEKVPFFAADNKGKMAGGGMLGYKKGGRIDGCAIKGKTKGTYR